MAGEWANQGGFRTLTLEEGGMIAREQGLCGRTEHLLLRDGAQAPNAASGRAGEGRGQDRQLSPGRL